MPSENVVNLAAERKARGKRFCRLLSVVLDVESDLKEGDLVAFSMFGGDVMFSHWGGRTGRAENGRFVIKGSSQEHSRFECGLKYSPADILAGRVKILGIVKAARDDGITTLPNRPATGGGNV